MLRLSSARTVNDWHCEYRTDRPLAYGLWLIAYGSYVPTICHKRSALCHFGSHRLERFEFFFLAAFDFQLNCGVLDVEALLEGLLDAVEDLMKIAAVFYHSVSA